MILELELMDPVIGKTLIFVDKIESDGDELFLTLSKDQNNLKYIETHPYIKECGDPPSGIFAISLMDIESWGVA